VANLKEVKNRISSVISTQQITKAMKMVAAAKLRKAQDKIIQMRPYAQKLNSILQNVASGNLNVDDNDFVQVREERSVLLIVITSDRGLCGAFNSNVNKAALRRMNYLEEQNGSTVTILPLGKKANDFFTKRKAKKVVDFLSIFSELNFESARKVADFVMNDFRKKEFDRVEIIYNQFKNVATQILTTEQMLPIQQVGGEGGRTLDYIFEPSKEYIVRELIPTSLKIQLYRALLESNAAEHGARMTAMDKATENAGDLLDNLRLDYNRTRQAAITKELSEIVAGADAL
jgi:F-type H+-transporting ATPase subunit gamma